MSTKINSKVKAVDENFPKMEKQKLMSAFLGEAKKAPLKTIQPTADGRHGSSKSKPVKKMISSKILTDRTPLKIFEDKKRMFQEFGTQTEKKELEIGTQTDVTGTDGVDLAHSEAHNDSGIDQEAYDLMVRDPIPESYWRELAEERRLSLAEALSENELLHQSMEELKEENLNLSQMASQTEYLASVLNSLVGEEETSKTKDASDDEKSETDSDEVFNEEKDSKCDSKSDEVDNDSAEHSDGDNDTPEDSKSELAEDGSSEDKDKSGDQEESSKDAENTETDH